MKAIQLHEILWRIARHGNTTALVEHARAVGATVIVGGRKEAERLRRDAKVAAIPIDAPSERFAGLTAPIVVDPSGLHAVAQAWRDSECATERTEARAALAERRLAASSAKVASLSRQLVQAQDEIADLREQLAALQGEPVAPPTP